MGFWKRLIELNPFEVAGPRSSEGVFVHFGSTCWNRGIDLIAKVCHPLLKIGAASVPRSYCHFTNGYKISTLWECLKHVWHAIGWNLCARTTLLGGQPPPPPPTHTPQKLLVFVENRTWFVWLITVSNFLNYVILFISNSEYLKHWGFHFRRLCLLSRTPCVFSVNPSSLSPKGMRGTYFNTSKLLMWHGNISGILFQLSQNYTCLACSWNFLLLP